MRDEKAICHKKIYPKKMTEIAVIIEALFIGDKRKAVSYMELFILKNYPPPALPIH